MSSSTHSSSKRDDVQIADAREDKRVSLVGDSEAVPGVAAAEGSAPVYRLYKRRFSGLFGFVILTAVSAMGWPWFGPISNSMAADFDITLDQVNWLGNIVACVYLPTAILIPFVCSRWGIRRCCDIGAVALILAAWIRYAGTAKGLSNEGSYALLIIGQFFAAIAQPIFQVLGPMYSETWFDLNGRTTATMIIAVANPVGGAIGQLISPIPGNTRTSILILGIISTASIPFLFLIREAPPIPPTYSGSKKPQSLIPLVRALLGGTGAGDGDEYMTVRERIDFAIVFLVFGVLVAGSNGFALLTSQIFAPHGYSDTLSGLFGATLLLSGLLCAILTAPLFDKHFTHHLARTSKLLVPLIALAWLALVWAVRPHATGGLFALMAVIGGCSVTMLPVGLELGCELTRNADASSALLWFAGNLFGIVFVLGQGALRAGEGAEPPLNMRRALVFNAAFIMGGCVFIFGLRGRQARREMDVRMRGGGEVR